MLFLNCEQTTRYFQIIENAQKNPPTGYSEKHHIVPRCFGGTNQKTNLVRLSGRDHFICHQLLIDMLPKDSTDRAKMVFALNRFIHGLKKSNYDVTPDEYERIKTLQSTAVSEREKQRVKNGTHNFLGGAIQRKSNNDRIKRGINPIKDYWNRLTPEERSQKLIERTQVRIENGTHNFNGSASHKKGSQKGGINLWGKFTPEDLSNEQSKRCRKGLLVPGRLEKFQKNLARANAIRWARWRMRMGKSPKPGDDDLLKGE